MTMHTVDLPAIGLASASSSVLAQGAAWNYLQFGSVVLVNNNEPYFRKANGWVFFDRSPLITLSPAPWHFRTATIFLNSWSPNRDVTASIHRVIPNAVSMGWTRYTDSGGVQHDWSVQGGEGGGSDIVSTPMATKQFLAGQTYFEIPLDLEAFIDFYQNARPLMFRTTAYATGQSGSVGTQNLTDIFIRVTLNISGLAGDVTIF